VPPIRLWRPLPLEVFPPYERRLALHVVGEFAHTQAEAKLRMLLR
jgi:hypothetical protein